MIETRRGGWLLPLMLLAVGGGARADGDGLAWPQWRGPTRDGKIAGDPWPESLRKGSLEQLWRVELGPSYSGPIVARGRVFVTETREEKHEVVRALDAETGRELWATRWDGAMNVAEVGASMGSWIRATPTLDGDDLLVAGMRDVLVCLDASTGAVRWRADFHERYGTPIPELGLVSSPLVVGDGVYVQAADSFVRVDRRTGKSVWRTLIRRDVGQGAYSSPDFGVVHDRPQLLVADIDDIAGIDPPTGDVLWKRRLDSYDQGCILAPIIYGAGIFTSTRASRTGYYPLTVADGRLTLGDGWKSRLVVYMSHPIVIGDHAYLHLKNGRFASLDLRSGKDNWISTERFGRYCSMICREDRILALTDEGRLLLIHARPERFELVDSLEISSVETWGHLAMAGKRLYVRERDAIAAYRWGSAAE